jgi:hypothetical protein
MNYFPAFHDKSAANRALKKDKNGEMKLEKGEWYRRIIQNCHQCTRQNAYFLNNK